MALSLHREFHKSKIFPSENKRHIRPQINELGQKKWRNTQSVYSIFLRVVRKRLTACAVCGKDLLKLEAILLTHTRYRVMSQEKYGQPSERTSEILWPSSGAFCECGWRPA